MAPGARRWLLAVWLCFVARGVFHAVLLPLWEGYDEWAHVAYVQLLAYGGGLPELGRTGVSREVQESLFLTPLPYGHFDLGRPFLTHDDYWRLPATEREQKRRQLTGMPRRWAREHATAPLLNHEAQQPPLYYAMLAPIQWAAGGASLPVRVLLMRLASLLVASMTILLGFAVARAVFRSDALAAGTAALISAMPGFVMTAGRVANDGLAAVIFAALAWVMVSGDRLRGTVWAPLAGALLGAGLLTKAYFLTAAPAVALVCAWRVWRSRGARARATLAAAVVFGVAGALAGWWYVRNQALTGTWSGLQQVAARRNLSLWDLAARIPDVDWRRFLDAVFLSHVWSGNWSFLQLRSWIYHLLAAVAVLAAAGLLASVWRDRETRPGALVLAGFYGFFWLGLCYHELTFSVLGLSSGAGWYLSAVAAVEATLAVLGLTALSPAPCRRFVPLAGTVLFALLDLYATHFLLMPYYTGLTAHRAGGSLESFHLSQLGGGGFQTMMSRMALAPPATFVVWLCFLAATLALPLAAGLAARSKLS
jgi:4-amino-4-deoxy-L-arabinose transferase-like glycosyltransferase